MVGKWQARGEKLAQGLRGEVALMDAAEIEVETEDPECFPVDLADGLYYLILKGGSEHFHIEPCWKVHSGWEKTTGKITADFEMRRIYLFKGNKDGRLVRVQGVPNRLGMIVVGKDESPIVADTAPTSSSASTKAEMEVESDPDRIVFGDLTVGGKIATPEVRVGGMIVAHEVHAKTLHVTGPTAVFEGVVQALDFKKRSDRRFKDAIVPMTMRVEEFLSKRGYEYDLMMKDGTKRHQFGFVAQEWVTDYPALVEEDSRDKSLYMDYDGIVALHHETLRAIFAQVKDQEGQLLKLSAEYMTIQTILSAYSATSPRFDDDLIRNLQLRLEEPPEKFGQLKHVANKVSDVDLVMQWVDDGIRESSHSSPRKPPGHYFYRYFRHWEKSQSRVEGRDPYVPLRDYQVEASMKILHAKDAAMLVMPTGTGKTMTAGNVCRILIPPGPGLPNQCALFVVQMGALLDQQQRMIRSCVPDHESWNVGVAGGGGYRYIGDTKCSPEASIQDLVNKCHVLVVTAGLLMNEMSRLNWNAICLVVMDEVHHARGQSPFAKVLEYIQTLPNKPKVLGMSATPGAIHRSVDAAVLGIQALMQRHGQGTELVTISESDERIKSHLVIPIVERVQILDRSSDSRQMLLDMDQRVRNLREQVVDNIYEFGLTEKDGEDEEPGSLAHFPAAEQDRITGKFWKWTKKVFRRVGECSQKRKDGRLQPLFRQSFLLTRLCELALAARDIHVANVVELVLELIGEATKRVQDGRTGDEVQLLFDMLVEILEVSEVEHPKLTMLVQELEKQSRLSSEFKAMVRVETRMAARKLSAYFKEKYRAALLLGRSQRTNDQTYSLSSMQSNLSQFRMGEAQVLISTSVIQEGIDIKSCDLVVCYSISATSSGANFIQLSGRARKPGGRFVVFLQGPAEEISFDLACKQSYYQELAIEDMF